MGTLLIRPPGHRRDVTLRPAATAMVWLGEGHAHETIAVPGVALGAHDVLVAVEMATLCDADIRVLRGGTPAAVPVVLGHECVGRVIATGDDGAETVDGSPVRIGDRVVWLSTISCGACDRCAEGLAQRCRTLGRYGHDRIGVHGDLTGAFGSHVQLRAGTAIVRVPESLPAAVLAPAGCATARAWAAIARAARDRRIEGAAVRIHGADLLGVTAAAIAVERGACVEVRDDDPARAARAERFGARSLTRDPEIVIVPSDDGVEEAVRDVADGGVVVLLGAPARHEPAVIDVSDLARRLVTVAGVQDATPRDLVDAVAFLAGRGRAYPFADAVGRVRPLSEIDDAVGEAIASDATADAPLRIGLVPGR